MMDVSGLTLTNLEKQQLAKASIGGVILFSRNFKDIYQVKSLIQSIRLTNQNLLIAVDHEGGRVQRFREGFTHLPAMAKLGEIYDQNPDHALEQAASCGYVLAAELLAIGVDFSFAPVLDLDYDVSSVIGDRAFHSNPDVVVKLASSLIEGMHNAGMKCVGKHFPGHGFVAADSHLDLPVDGRPLNDISQDMAVFKALINHGLDAVMPAHVVYSQVDLNPAGFSSKWIKEILQEKLGFGGVIFSDDLSMQGAHFIKSIVKRVQVSLESGCDMVLICNHPELVEQVIDRDWTMSEKLQSMRGIKSKDVGKITYSQHLENISDLL
ncbi:Beta N-acetyl-glucosaminidase (EC [uncultured Gammaproteobacteria bacterium]|nr:beta-N-acetylglucosaminidase (EC 3.2.1.52) [uncultured Gammaproteobacteria bacterium]SSC10962.1 Beta N-acetyl-glucosaminidase [thiotrophic endosymbiont of Bathymodiolus puteoserpentis (Logatchev)]CAC9595095.1 beta-N-acetylglucosaminidase (EC 3.2.1.52) [uncultured Gammaproteobacteria bacterium]CAC9630492.1 beta-N-acetylglucosaminidase (EC 3.2.1.52) [uncultured Gammaproteobacteria bacterium]CAC9959160.1 beta-N-acetylglucosaminidase (EC 3.2.1.52) [uncultured Gammaproteobacteria bacterium]